MIDTGIAGHDQYEHLSTLSRRLGDALRTRGWSCGTAESCTGGGIAHVITWTPGSSDYLLGGVVAYANAVKERQLGVSPATLASVGAVSDACAREMALGVRSLLHVDLGISSTGIAGPGGATARKPVGLVYIAVSTPETTQSRELRLTGDRLAIMRAAMVAALELTLALVSDGRAAHKTE